MNLIVVRVFIYSMPRKNSGEFDIFSQPNFVETSRKLKSINLRGVSTMVVGYSHT